MVADPSILAASFDPTAASVSAKRHARILVVSAFPALRHALATLLVEAGCWTGVSRTADDALTDFARNDIDIVVVDSGEAGDYALLRSIRARTALPILALVCPQASGGEASAFDAGADDCLTWADGADADSRAVRELTHRINALLRRMRPGPAAPRPDVLAGPAGISLQPRAHEASAAGVSIDFTPKEFAMLRLLLEHRGEVLTADLISETLWGHETFGSRNFVEAHVSRLRQKLRIAGAVNVITTVRGVGYKIR
jgi:DNA-binding response OmpR family regulator